LIMELSVVIITYNSKGLLVPCIESVRAAARKIECEIIVVENGSGDGTGKWLREQGDVKTISNTANRGVAPARNQGLGVAKGRYLLILDADTVVEPGAFDALVACMDLHPGVGLGAPKLIGAQGNLQYTCRNYPTVFSKIYRRLPLGFARKRLSAEQLEDWPHDAERAVDYTIGACQIFRRQAYEQIGPLDESIFYGPEDIDYCIRMWRVGWTVMYFPQAVVRHLERRITKKLFSKMTLKHAWGLVHFFWKYKYITNTGKLPGSGSAGAR
jgi:N-acetylglucosaminyl-diphospho-decaprenol L-rhamnosyltransferase